MATNQTTLAVPEPNGNTATSGYKSKGFNPDDEVTWLIILTVLSAICGSLLIIWIIIKVIQCRRVGFKLDYFHEDNKEPELDIDKAKSINFLYNKAVRGDKYESKNKSMTSAMVNAEDAEDGTKKKESKKSRHLKQKKSNLHTASSSAVNNVDDIKDGAGKKKSKKPRHLKQMTSILQKASSSVMDSGDDTNDGIEDGTDKKKSKKPRHLKQMTSILQKASSSLMDSGDDTDNGIEDGTEKKKAKKPRHLKQMTSNLHRAVDSLAGKFDLDLKRKKKRRREDDEELTEITESQSRKKKKGKPSKHTNIKYGNSIISIPMTKTIVGRARALPQLPQGMNLDMVS